MTSAKIAAVLEQLETDWELAACAGERRDDEWLRRAVETARHHGLAPGLAVHLIRIFVGDRNAIAHARGES